MNWANMRALLAVAPFRRAFPKFCQLLWAPVTELTTALVLMPKTPAFVPACAPEPRFGDARNLQMLQTVWLQRGYLLPTTTKWRLHARASIGLLQNVQQLESSESPGASFFVTLLGAHWNIRCSSSPGHTDYGRVLAARLSLAIMKRKRPNELGYIADENPAFRFLAGRFGKILVLTAAHAVFAHTRLLRLGSRGAVKAIQHHFRQSCHARLLPSANIEVPSFHMLTGVEHGLAMTPCRNSTPFCAGVPVPDRPLAINSNCRPPG